MYCLGLGCIPNIGFSAKNVPALKLLSSPGVHILLCNTFVHFFYLLYTTNIIIVLHTRVANVSNFTATVEFSIINFILKL